MCLGIGKLGDQRLEPLESQAQTSAPQQRPRGCANAFCVRSLARRLPRRAGRHAACAVENN
eukprot:12762535-Prorocentrum_lima.AAC.1